MVSNQQHIATEHRSCVRLAARQRDIWSITLQYERVLTLTRYLFAKRRIFITVGLLSVCLTLKIIDPMRSMYKFVWFCL